MSDAKTSDSEESGRDVSVAIASIGSMPDSVEAASAYREAMRSAYWTDKDVLFAVAIADAGVHRLTSDAAEADEPLAHELQSAAKGLLYDVASFTWIGWGEPDVEIGSDEASAGLAAARLNLSMAIDLDKGDLPVSRAYWMLGAHLLTANDLDAAAEAFEQSVIHARAAGAAPEVGLGEAFGALTALAAGGSTGDLDRAIARLGDIEDGSFFVDQVLTARRVLGI